MNHEEKLPFSKKYPRLNFCIGLIILILVAIGVIYLATFCIEKFSAVLRKVIDYSSKLDVVIIVAMITGGLSVLGVVLNAIISKLIDYKKSRQEYLAQKREKPYGEFVDMVYKILENTRKSGSYSEQNMFKDISKFSKEITLWGSDRVVSKWVQFRTSSGKTDGGYETLILLEEIMNAMRRDLGIHKVKRGNLLGFFISDIEEIKKVTQWKSK